MDGQGGNAEGLAAIVAAVMAFAVVGVLILLAIQAVICWLLSSCFQVIPQPFRKMEPGMVWLLLIPCFGLVWNFFVFPRLAQSFKAYFDSVGRTDVDDCGEKIGWAFAICAACSIVPYLGMLAGLAALVLLIVYLVKALGLKGQVKA